MRMLTRWSRGPVALRRLVLTIGALLAFVRPGAAEGEFIVIADATADPCGLGSSYGAVLKVRLTTGQVSVVSCGDRVLPPLVIPAGSKSIFRRPRAVAVDPRDGSIVLVDSDSAAAGIAATEHSSSSVSCPHPTLADPPGRVFRIDPDTGVVSLISNGTTLDSQETMASVCLGQSLFVNPQAVIFNTTCLAIPGDCHLIVIDSSANPRRLISGTSGLRMGAVFGIPYPVAGAPGGPVRIRADGSVPLLPAPMTTVFGRLAGVAAGPPVLTQSDDVLYVADTAADPGVAGVAGHRPGVVWRIGAVSTIGTVQIAMDGSATGGLPGIPFVTPSGVALDLPASRLYLTDVDVGYSAGSPPRQALVSPLDLPGAAFEADLGPLLPLPIGRFGDGSNAAAPPACWDPAVSSLFANPRSALVVADDEYCAGNDRRKLLIVDADAHPTCGRLSPPPLSQRFDGPGPGAVYAMLVDPLLSNPISVVADGSNAKFPYMTTDTSLFSSPGGAVVRREAGAACSEVATKLLAPGALCSLNAACFGGANGKNLACTPLGWFAADTCSCACDRVQRQIATIQGVTCPGTPCESSCPDRKTEAICRLCGVLPRFGTACTSSVCAAVDCSQPGPGVCP